MQEDEELCCFCEEGEEESLMAALFEENESEESLMAALFEEDEELAIALSLISLEIVEEGVPLEASAQEASN